MSLKEKFALDKNQGHALPAGLPVLKDFDWNLNMCVSSSTMSTLQKGFMQLQLQIAQPTSSTQPKVVHLEFTKSELHKLLQELAPIDKVLTDLNL
mmetsp:Transcript_123502/g.214208  ORF Transcript_123502/g.214208 Transcript_123502/m.214208 type:complete len:95 (-) Transcript_123502:462-746(-)